LLGKGLLPGTRCESIALNISRDLPDLLSIIDGDFAPQPGGGGEKTRAANIVNIAASDN
jgi:hypothetical protein